MAEGGFDDFEMKNNKKWISEEEEEENENEETQFYSPDEDFRLSEDNIGSDFEKFKKQRIKQHFDPDEDFGVGDERYGMLTPKERIPNEIRMKNLTIEDRKKNFKKLFDFPLRETW